MGREEADAKLEHPLWEIKLHETAVTPADYRLERASLVVRYLSCAVFLDHRVPVIAECFLRCTGGVQLQQAAVKRAVGNVLWISCPFVIYQMIAAAVNCALPACTVYFALRQLSTVHAVVFAQCRSSHSACFWSGCHPGEISRYHGNLISRKCKLQPLDH